MHILMLPGWLSNRWEPNPLSGLFFLEQAQLMRRLGEHRINVFYPKIASAIGYWRRHRGFPSWHGLEIDNDDGMEIWIKHHVRWLQNRKKSAIFVAQEMWMQYVKKHGKPDVLWVQSAAEINGFICQYLLSNFDIPYFVVEHSARFFRPLSAASRRFYQKIFADALFVSSVSEFLKKSLTPLCPGSVVLHNPVAPIFCRSDIVCPPKSPYIFYSIGRLEKDKGHETVIAAFSRLLNSGADCRLKIVGGGALLPLLGRQTENLGITAHVEFVGILNREALTADLPLANAYVSASAHETFNLSLAEAMVCGVPCVATPTGVAVDVIDTENGVMTEGFDEESVFAGMKKVYEREYDRKSIALKARQQFSPQHYVDTLSGLINRRVSQ